MNGACHGRHAGPAGRSLLALAGVLAGAVAACSSGASHHDRGGADAAASEAPRASRAQPGVDGAPPLVAPAAAAPTDAATNAKAHDAPPRAGEASAPVDLVTIHVLVEPPQRAHVIWGAKDFGLGPLDIRRPRGSGPLDLLVRAPGYLTLHTRAFTDRDNTLSVHLVPEAEATRFPGYQAPAPTVTGHGTTPSASQRTTTRAMRAGKPSDGTRAP